MGKHFSFCAKNIAPLSQNFRPSSLVNNLGNALMAAYGMCTKASNFALPRTPSNWLTGDLSVKAFYIHKVRDYKDADNISKPLWDALNKRVYKDDRQIKYLETLKVDITRVGSCEFDISDIDNEDLNDLTEFLFNPTTTVDRLLYIEVADLDLKKVRL